MIQILIGTNRQDSLTLELAKYYQNTLKNFGQESELIDLQQLPPDFTATALYENVGKNVIINQFQARIDTHEKFVFIIPEYNGSFPGILKTFIDALRYPDTWQGKKTALLGFSAGMQGGILALSHWADVMSYLGAEVLSLRLKIPQIHRNFQEQTFSTPLYQNLLNEQIEKFIRF